MLGLFSVVYEHRLVLVSYCHKRYALKTEKFEKLPKNYYELAPYS